MLLSTDLQWKSWQAFVVLLQDTGCLRQKLNIYNLKALICRFFYEFKVLHIVLMAKVLLVEKYDNARGITALPSSSVCIKTHVESYTWLA